MICKRCGASEEQHDSYAQAIGARFIYSWDEGVPLPVVECERFEPREAPEETKPGSWARQGLKRGDPAK
jgi:hypothetical protein